MGYSVANLLDTRNYVLANGAALFIAYALHFFFQMMVMCCFKRDQKQRNTILERLLENSRVMYWFGVATMFSVFPPFYYGLHNVILGWVTLLLLFLMHIFAIVQRCDRERSVWSYFYYFYHFSAGVWIVTSLCFGYAWSEGQDVPSDSSEW